MNEQTFDAVFLDVVMPRMSGFDILQHMKSSEDLCEIPVFMLSGLEDDHRAAAKAIIGLGAIDFFPKDFDLDLMRSRLDAALKEKRGQDREAEYFGEPRVFDALDADWMRIGLWDELHRHTNTLSLPDQANRDAHSQTAQVLKQLQSIEMYWAYPGVKAVENRCRCLENGAFDDLSTLSLALILYAGIATVFIALLGPKTAQGLALGGILIFGVAYLIAQGLADQAPAELTKRTTLASLGAAVAYFAFQAIAETVWGAALPPAPVPGPLEWALIVLAVASFGLVALAQALFPLWAHHPSTAGLRVHLANGFYLNALLDRSIGGFRIAQTR